MFKHPSLYRCFSVLFLLSGSALRAAPAYRSTQEADAALGNSMTPAGEIIEPRDIVADFPRRKIYVVDALRNRVLRFAVSENLRPAKTAEAVFGQANFENSFAAASANSFSGCSGACVDAAGRLWVADTENHRVLRFDDAWKRHSGAAANAILGQPTFLAKESGAAANRMNRPHAVAVSTAGDLYVADTDNHRVLRFSNAAGKANGAAADGVLGQAGYGLSSSALSAGRLNGPQGLALARSDIYVEDNTAHLYVADTNNNRVLRFDRPAALVNGASAAIVLGQHPSPPAPPR